MARQRKKKEEVSLGGAGEDLVTIGEKFRAARQQQGWAIEDVSRILRLRPAVLREIESDDLGSFTHASYARMSLLGYARLLGLSEDEVRAWLPAKGDLSSGEFTYLDQLQNPAPAARREDFAEQRLPKRNPVGTLLKIAAALILFLGAGYAYIIWHNLGRLQPGGAAVSPDAVEPAPPIPFPAVEIESPGESVTDTPFQIAPPDSPAPFLEQDALALELHIPMAAATPWPDDADKETPAGQETVVEYEVRAALPVDAPLGDSPGADSNAPAP